MTDPNRDPFRAPEAPAAARRRPLLDLSASLVRRGYVCDYDAGERPLPGPDKVRCGMWSIEAGD